MELARQNSSSSGSGRALAAIFGAEVTIRHVTRVCVIVPSYNYAKYLRVCINSVLRQEGVDVRVLVVDNKSTDSSVAIARAMAGLDARVEVREHAKNVGLISSLNEGLRWSIDRDSDLTLTLSADDVLAPGALARAAEAFNAHPEVGLVYGRTSMLRGDADPPSPRTTAKGLAIYEGVGWIARVCRLGRNPLFDPEVVMRTNVYAEIGCYNAVLPHTSDMEMWLRSAARTDVGKIHGAVQAFYRVHDKQLSRSAWSDRIGDLEARRLAFDEFFRQDGDLLPDGNDLARLARRALSRDALRLGSQAYSRGETGRVDVDDLVAFAQRLDATSLSSPSAAGLRVRRRLGPTASRPLRLLEFSRIAHGLSSRLEWTLARLNTLADASAGPVDSGERERDRPQAASLSPDDEPIYRFVRRRE